jgi:hypothetical protein
MSFAERMAAGRFRYIMEEFMQILLGLLMLLVLPVVAADSALSGTWKIEADFEGNPRSYACTFRQEGGKLTGSCKLDQGERDITGEVSGQRVTWKHKAEYNGEALTLTYVGTVESPSQIKGNVDVQPMAVTGTFTAAKEL